MLHVLAWLKRPCVAWSLGLIFVYVLAIAFIFDGTWSCDVAPIMPDCATFYPVDACAQWLKSLVQGRDVIPSDLMHVLGGMYLWQEAQIGLAVLLAALGVAFYLRGRGLSFLASFGGGSAFGLMGYSLTLYSAGHLGWFIWLMYGPFAFGLVDRAVRKGGVRNWILLGGVLAWGSARQPDLWLIFTVVTFTYGVWCVVCACLVHQFHWKNWLGGVSLCAVTALLVGSPQFTHALTQDLAGRKSQIASVPSPADEDPATAREKKFVFCTNWSLPPDEVREFWSAEINGSSSDPRISRKPGNRPYQGRIGQRVVTCERVDEQGMTRREAVRIWTGESLQPNERVAWSPYRQHSLYMGVIACLLALLGVLGLIWWGLSILLSRKSTIPALREASPAHWGDLIFWLAWGSVALLSALGCWTPFYRACVFVLPFGDLVRAPLKFVHVVELVVAICVGYGLEFLLALPKQWALRGGTCAAWLKPVQTLLAGLLVCALVLNVCDLASVGARYCARQSVALARAPNEAAEKIKASGGGALALLNVLMTRAPYSPQELETVTQMRQKLGETFVANHITVRDEPSQKDVRFFFVPTKVYETLKQIPDFQREFQAGSLREIGSYEVDVQKGIHACAMGASYVLLQRMGVEAPAHEKSVPPARRAQWMGLVSILASLGVLVCGLLPARIW